MGNLPNLTTDVAAATYAPLTSPPLAGTPTAPTAATGTSTTQIATTAFVASAVAGVTGATPGVTSFNTRTGGVSLLTADVTGVLGSGLPIASGGTGATTAAGAIASLGAMPSQLAPVAGRFYTAPTNGLSTVGQISLAGNQPICALPVFISAPTTLKYIAFDISTASTVTFNVHLGVYNDNGGVPSTLLVDGGALAIAANASGVQILTLGTPLALARGFYWAAMQASYASAAPSFRATNSGSPGPLALANLGAALSQGVSASAVLATGVNAAGTYGALTNTFTAGGALAYFTNANCPLIWLGF